MKKNIQKINFESIILSCIQSMIFIVQVKQPEANQ